jgi:pimeloyl-ACP methyl ester carboxylesterase
MKRIFQYRNGNSISYAEYGNENGYPILVQHGLIASICDYHLFESLTKSGIRLISIARPGYGESSPYYMSNVAEWGEIVSILVDELRLSRFDILGISSGAPYSYSIGHKLPYKARNIFIFSGIPVLFDDRVLAFWPYPVDKNADIPSLQKLAHDLFFSNLSQEALSQNDIKDTMKNNCFGIALDFKLRCNNWGFPLSEIEQDVYMQHSKTDDQIPFAAAEITSKLLPRCHFDIRESGGHFSKETFAQFINSTILQRYANRNARE